MTANITFQSADKVLRWADVTTAIAEGHSKPKAEVADSFIRQKGKTLLTRNAWIDGMGVAVKAATVTPEQDQTINGGVMLFDDDTGVLRATLDFHLVTKWKTAGDSLLGAKLLARPDSKKMLIMGAGTVSGNLCDAYRSHWPDIEISIWNRTQSKAEKLANEKGAKLAPNLEDAVSSADIICGATMSSEPILHGSWLRKGQHIDLIGAYRADMREVDDETLKRARIFVDNRNTTMDHIGELKDPLERGVIEPTDVIADFYDLGTGLFQRQSKDEITLFKNGGGAHMDLMVSDLIYRTVLAP